MTECNMYDSTDRVSQTNTKIPQQMFRKVAYASYGLVGEYLRRVSI